jgi:hypothetical protein
MAARKTSILATMDIGKPAVGNSIEGGGLKRKQ